MEMATDDNPLTVEEGVDLYLQTTGLTWIEYLKNEIGYDPSPMAVNAWKSKTSSGLHETTVASASALLSEILGEDGNF